MRIFNSTKLRLTVWYSGVLALILTVFAAASYFLFAYALQTQTDQTLKEISAGIVASVIQELDDETAADRDAAIKNEVYDAVSETNFNSYRLFVFSGDENLIAQTSGRENETGIDAATAKDLPNKFDENPKTFDFSENPTRIYYKKFQIEGRSFSMFVAHPLAGQKELLSKILYAYLISVPLSLLFVSFVGYLLARKSLAPIGEMSGKAEKITARNLHERLPVENEADELGRLAATFNGLLARLDLSFEQQKRFMADASHELRTPVAIVRGEAEVSLTKPERGTAEYKETIAIIHSESVRMSRIIEDLFTLARADAGENAPRKNPVYVRDILEETVKSFRTLARKNAIDILVTADGEMPLRADEQLLRRLFTNLLDNAVKYARSSVEIAAKTENKCYKIKISDDGEGITPENRARIFERFYRADKARSRSDTPNGAGAGLGLAIGRWIAEAHDGSLDFAASESSKTVFVVLLPRDSP